MRNHIKTVFRKEMAKEMESLLIDLEKLDYNVEQIVGEISSFNEETRIEMAIRARSICDAEFASKIEEANEKILQNRIDAFKLSVENGTHEEFLSKFKWHEKITLTIDMKLCRFGLFGEKPLTPEEEKYSKIIADSINEDMLKQALSEGFSSVDEWQEYQMKISDSESYFEEPRA